MNDYDYLNARVRGMAATLFSPEIYEQILASAADNLLVDTLLASEYQRDLEKALSAHGGSQLPAIEAALIANLHATFARIREMAPPEPFRLLTLLMNRWDLSNILTLVRARLAGASSLDVSEAVLPVGQYDAPQLGDLAMEADLRSLADALNSWDYAVALMARRTLLDALAAAGPQGRGNAAPRGAGAPHPARPRSTPSQGRGSTPSQEADPLELERTLLRSYFGWALAQLGERDRNQVLVRDALRREIDVANVLSALQRIQARSGEAASHRAATDAEPAPEPLPRGRLEDKTLKELEHCDGLEPAFELLEETYFAPAVEKGILGYGQTRSLAVMEWMLQRVVIEHGCRLFRVDNLAVSVPLGYLWRKYAEMANLRILARGKAYHMPSNAMKELLILV